MVTPEVTFVLANRNISEGEEIFIDYVEGITDQDKRNNALAKWGIKEEQDGSITEQERVKITEEDEQVYDVASKKADEANRLA